MRVEKFSLFFPPTVWKTRRGETEYAIGAIPAGGYVKITGMNPSEQLSDEERTRSYYAQPVWKRVVVIAAGPAVNLVLGFVLLAVFFATIGYHEGNGVGVVSKGFPAQGVLHKGDLLVAVDGHGGSVNTVAKRIAAHRCAAKPPVDHCKA